MAAPFILQMGVQAQAGGRAPTGAGSWKGLGETKAQALALGLN